MIDEIFTIPGTRNGVENIALAVLVQAAKDMAIPSVCPAAMEWFMSDEYRTYSTIFGADSDALLRKLFCHRYEIWKSWTRTVRTFQVRQEDRVLAIGIFIKSRKLAILCDQDEFYTCHCLDDVAARFEGCAIEWTAEGMAR